MYQCYECPLARWHRGLPVTRNDPSEPAFFECGITGETFDVLEAPEVGKCQYLIGWESVAPHPFAVAKARGEVYIIKWLSENVSKDMLRRAAILAKE